MNRTLSALALSLCLPLLSFAGDFQAPAVPQGKNCLSAMRIASIKGLPDFSVSSSAAINPEWKGISAIVFNSAKFGLRLPLDPWASGRHELKIGYIGGGSYSGFSVKVNGEYLGKVAACSGKAMPLVASFKTQSLLACGNVLELIPDGPAALGLFFTDCEPMDFEEVPVSSWTRPSELEMSAFLLNVVPYSSPYLKLSSETPCVLKVNGKDFIRCAANGSALKQLENPGSRPAKLELKFDSAPGKFKIESSVLGGGRIVPSVPGFMNSDFSLQDCPKAKIANGLVEAMVALPDPEKGFYRGIRFEQAGMVYSLKAGGHEFIGGSDPASHDPFLDVCGTAEEFSEAVGFHEPDLDCFLKIGVGVFERPLARDYAFGWLYIPKELFKWNCQVNDSSVEFRQNVSMPQGWGYEYVKRLSLTPGAPGLLIEHTLKNTGARRLVSAHYCHNYFLVDGKAPGPDYSLDCSFRPHLSNPDAASGYIQSGSKLSFKGPETLFSVIWGGLDPNGSRFVISHKPSGASISITEPSPSFRQAVFVNKEGICPESFFRIDLGPGESVSWSREYLFESK